MPVLKFICPKCNHIYEELVRVGQTAPCPKCGETHVERYYQGKCSFGMLGSSAGYTPPLPQRTRRIGNPFNPFSTACFSLTGVAYSIIIN